MDNVQRCHEVLLQQRTQIRHHATVHLWMKRCWQAVPHADPHAMTQDECEDMYSILMYEMTICWDEELNDGILAKIWARDAASYATLNFERFGCSIFYFVEMWVEEITLAEYEKIFGHVYRILSGHEQRQLVVSRSTASPDYKPRTFKPTLESFNNALDNERAMDELQMNFGKSIAFNAQQYYRHFGTPTTHLQAFQATLLHLQSRVHMEPSEVSPSKTTSRDPSAGASPTRASTISTTAVSTATMLRQQLRESRKRPASSTRSTKTSGGGGGSGTIDERPPSPTRCPQQASSPSRMSRPVAPSASLRAAFVLAYDTGEAPASSPSSPPSDRLRHGGDAFVLTGKSVLQSP